MSGVWVAVALSNMPVAEGVLGYVVCGFYIVSIVAMLYIAYKVWKD